VQYVTADVSTLDGARRACHGADVVYHCAQPAYTRWAHDFPPLNRCLLAALSGTGTKLVFADNLYPYGPISGPISEDTPQEPGSRKGAVRLQLARELLEAHRAGDVRVALGRSSDYYGPGGINSVAGAQLFPAVLRGKDVRWPARTDVPHVLHFLPDTARHLVTLGEHDDADGRAWVLPAADPLTGAEFVQLAASHAGTAARARATSKLAMRAAGLFIAPARELPDIWYQYAAPFTIDARAFKTAFPATGPTPHDVAIDRTLSWFRDRARVGVGRR
jgi:nucleoside-diphosphate-sugar epimerase